MESEGVLIKILSESDVSEKYLSWMKDENVIQYLECRWRAYSLHELRDFVCAMNSSTRDFLFGIFVGEYGHIGNIKIGCINHLHRFGDVGLLIGDSAARGKGYGTIAIRQATKYAFEELNLNKLIAGIYEPNIPSVRAFEKAGYRKAGVLEKHRFYKGRFVDEYLMEILK